MQVLIEYIQCYWQAFGLGVMFAVSVQYIKEKHNAM